MYKLFLVEAFEWVSCYNFAADIVWLTNKYMIFFLSTKF